MWVVVGLAVVQSSGDLGRVVVVPDSSGQAQWRSMVALVQRRRRR